MPHVFSVRRNLEILHVGFQDLDLNSREAEHGAVVVDELPDERGGAPQALRFFFDGGGLLGSEAEGLSEVVVSCGGFGLWFAAACRTRTLSRPFLKSPAAIVGPCSR